MNIREKLLLNNKGLCEKGPINIVILGDSVSQGALIDDFDYESVYWNRLKKMLNAVSSEIPVNMICSAIAGTTASFALKRLQKGVFDHSPDLVIVCFGLNDVNGEKSEYLDSLKIIFAKCKQEQTDVVFMTPNMLNTYVADDTMENFREYAKITAEYQNSGRMDDYIYSAVKLAEEMGITVCDCYSEWKKLYATEDTTLLLANRINHPVREMHQLFADKLYDIIINK